MTLENSKYYPRAIVLFFSGRWYRTRHIGSTWISLQRPPPLPPSLPPSPPPRLQTTQIVSSNVHSQQIHRTTSSLFGPCLLAVDVNAAAVNQVHTLVVVAAPPGCPVFFSPALESTDSLPRPSAAL